MTQTSELQAVNTLALPFDISRLVFWIALPVLLVAQGVIIVVTLRGRGQAGQQAIRVRGSTKLEFLWAIIPALMLAALLAMTYEALHASS
ncbi:MAG: hypothetical protein Q7T26_09800 [Dehalococcoidia bacterium]|nr:hypothetical protein [Dehalococcoidia bacterium]